MKVRGKNKDVDPVYHAHQRAWPLNVFVECDVTDEECNAMLADAHLEVDFGDPVTPAAPAVVPMPAVVASAPAPAEPVSQADYMEQIAPVEISTKRKQKSKHEE